MDIKDFLVRAEEYTLSRNHYNWFRKVYLEFRARMGIRRSAELALHQLYGPDFDLDRKHQD